MGFNNIIVIILHVFLSLHLYPSVAQSWIRVGYYWKGVDVHEDQYLYTSDLNSSLFTHLICGFAGVHSSSYKVISLSPSDEKLFSTFTDTVKQNNPSVTTLLSIGRFPGANSTFSSMVSTASYRKSFINSSINFARVYGFHGLDLQWQYPVTASDMFNVATLFREWRAAVILDAKNSSQPELILTAAVYYSPWICSTSYPTNSMQQNLKWVHVMADNHVKPMWANFTGAHEPLYNPSSNVNTDYGIRAWIQEGLSPNKLVLRLPYYGYAWKLVKSNQTGIGAPSSGAAFTQNGVINYKDIKTYNDIYGAEIIYNATYVMNYCTINETYWIGYDDVEAVRTKVSYAKEVGLLGYYAWQVLDDYNFVLSQAAAEVHGKNKPRPRLLIIVLIITGTLAFLLLCWMRNKKSKAKQLKDRGNGITLAGDLDTSAPNLPAYSLADVEAATNRFSLDNKVGQGGYGPVYKGILPNGEVIAVKKLSITSTQGCEEFKNEVMLTARLQHINLVRLLGFCIDREERILIYEYLPNKSLDYYIFDAIKRKSLDWKKRVDIIEGICQGLLYLQEYSRLTIIHRDIKISNVLLDKDMKPKISDFGMARIFAKNDLEAYTERVVGTYGYISPEYIQRGAYSTKSDVYSFGVVLLQIISGKKVTFVGHGHDNLSFIEYVYELWKDGKGTEFIDPLLDDTYSTCKLLRCLQIALLCVQQNPKERPTMLEVFLMLKNEATYVMIPRTPKFHKQNTADTCGSKLQLEACSLNDVTISELVPR